MLEENLSQIQIENNPEFHNFSCILGKPMLGFSNISFGYINSLISEANISIVIVFDETSPSSTYPNKSEFR